MDKLQKVQVGKIIMQISSISIFLIVIYLIVLKLLSIVAYRRSEQNSEDFFLVGRSLPSLLLSATLLATIVNGLAITAVPALVYEGGLLFGQMYVVCLVVPVLIYVFGPKISSLGTRYQVMTPAELFGSYYQSRPLVFLVASIGILATLPFMTIQLSAVGKIVESISQGTLSYQFGVSLCAISIGLYLYFGGARAVVWTDLIQSAIFMLVILSTAILFITWAGGFSTAFSTLSQQIPEKLSFNSTNTPRFIDNILSWPFAFFLWPQLFQRMFMAKTTKDIRKSAVITGSLLLTVIICSMLSGVSATSILYGKISDSDQLIAEMYRIYLPIGSTFIVLAAFATGMSTVDSMLLTLSSSCVRDFKFSNSSSANSQQEFTYARKIALLFVLLVTGLALSPIGRGAITPLVTLGASLATLSLWPLLGLHPLINLGTKGVYHSIILGLGAIILFKFSSISDIVPIGFATAGFSSGLLTFSTHLILNSRKARFAPTKAIATSQLEPEPLEDVIQEKVGNV